MKGELFRELDYKTDRAGVYQIAYPTSQATLHYGRLHSCSPSGKPGHPTCRTAWHPTCKKKQTLVAEGHWPLQPAGKVSQLSEDVPVFRHGPTNRPDVLVVKRPPCLLEYPRVER